jgi:hypothetical protein
MLEIYGAPTASFVTDAEAEVLLLILARARGAKGFSTAEAQKFLTEINAVRFQFHAVEMALKGALLLDVNENGLVFRKIKN